MRTFSSMSAAYPIILGDILDNGRMVSPDNKPTIELLDYSFSIMDPVNGGVPIGIGRKVGPKMMALDSLTNLSGLQWPKIAMREAYTLSRFANILTDETIYSDNDIANDTVNVNTGELFFQGSYGPRLFHFMNLIEQELRRDPHSRRAVATMWRKSDFEPYWKDRPCTTMIQFMIREKSLDLHVIMRANDAWTGTCYDVFQFGQLQAALAHVLNIPVGRYYHYATSLHLYMDDRDKAEALVKDRARHAARVDNPRETSGPKWAELNVNTFTSWRQLADAFKLVGMACLHQDGIMLPNKAPKLEAWYWNLLKGKGARE